MNGLKFGIGDRVKLSDEGIKRRIRTCDLGRVGRVVGVSRDLERFYVLWEGYSPTYREAFHGAFLSAALIEVVP